MVASSSGAQQGNYFSKEIKVLKVFGVSFTGNESLPYKIYSWVFLFATLYAYPLLDTYELTKHDFNGVANMMAYQTGALMGMAKLTVLLLNRIKFGKLLDKLQQAPFTPSLPRGGDAEEKLVEECVRITSAQSLTYWIGSGVTFVGIVLYTLRKRVVSSDYHDWQFPFAPLTVINVTYSPNFEISWAYQSLSVGFIAGTFTSIDVLLAAVLAHISYQFRILQNNLRRLVRASQGELAMKTTVDVETQLGSKNLAHEALLESCNPTFWKFLKTFLRQAVRYHVEIAELANDVEKVFSSLLLFTFLGTLCLICFTVYAATLVDSQALKLMYLAQTLISASQVLLVCYWGEQVVQESQLVGFAAYETDFVGTDPRFQRDLVLIMRRSLNPSILTAGKFTVVSLTTFAWILRTSYSSIMILYRANQDTA